MLDTPISIDVGGREVSTTASFNLGRVSQDSDIRIAEFWILGDVFLQNVHNAWDVGCSHVEFATLA